MNKFPTPPEQALVDSAEEFRDSMEALYELVALVDESADRLDDASASFERRMFLTHPSLENPGELHNELNAAFEAALEQIHAGNEFNQNDRSADIEDADYGDRWRSIEINLSALADKYGQHTLHDAMRAMLRERRPRATSPSTRYLSRR